MSEEAWAMKVLKPQAEDWLWMSPEFAVDDQWHGRCLWGTRAAAAACINVWRSKGCKVRLVRVRRILNIRRAS